VHRLLLEPGFGCLEQLLAHQCCVVRHFEVQEHSRGVQLHEDFHLFALQRLRCKYAPNLSTTKVGTYRPQLLILVILIQVAAIVVNIAAAYVYFNIDDFLSNKIAWILASSTTSHFLGYEPMMILLNLNYLTGFWGFGDPKPQNPVHPNEKRKGGMNTRMASAPSPG